MSTPGASELVRLALRRDRFMLPAWIYVLPCIAASGGYGLKAIYKTSASRATLASSIRSDPALLFLYGQLHGSSLGAIAAWRYLAYAAIGAALMSTFLVVRHTRADEETGRLELVGSTAVGRHVPLVVAMAVASVANLVLFVLTAVGTGGGRAAAYRGDRIRACRDRLRAGVCCHCGGGRPDQRNGQGRARDRDRRAGLPVSCSAASAIQAEAMGLPGLPGCRRSAGRSLSGRSRMTRWWVLALPLAAVVAVNRGGFRARRSARSRRRPDPAAARSGDRGAAAGGPRRPQLAASARLAGQAGRQASSLAA